MDRTVLIIDDDPFALYINQEIIQPLIATSLSTYLKAKQALLYVEEFLSGDSQVLIFLDLNMPEMNGWHFLDEIIKTQFNSNLSVVIVTSSVDENDSIRAYKYPCVKGFVIKPLEELSIKSLREVSNLSPFFASA